MKVLPFVLVMLMVGGGPGVAGAHADERQEDIAVLTEKKVTVWPRLYAERDADGLAEFLADGFRVLEPSGSVRTKEDEIRWLRETPPDDHPSNFLFTIEDIVFSGDNIAIVYGHGDSTRETEDGKPCRHHYWSSNTFINQDGTWKPVFSHVSGISCTPLE